MGHFPTVWHFIKIGIFRDYVYKPEWMKVTAVESDGNQLFVYGVEPTFIYANVKEGVK